MEERRTICGLVEGCRLFGGVEQKHGNRKRLRVKLIISDRLLFMQAWW